jgi:hypothetical protein
MLNFGLELFYNPIRIERAKKKIANICRFVKKFGVDPATACQIYEWMHHQPKKTHRTTLIVYGRNVGFQKRSKNPFHA